MSRERFLTKVFCWLVFLAIQPGTVAQDITTKAPLVGSWDLTATPSSTAKGGPSIAGLATFTSDGTVVETDTTEIVQRGTPGHGIWQPSPVFGSFFIRFTSLVANPDATLNARRIVTMTVALDSTGDHFSGGYTYEVVDATAHVLTTGSGTVTGQLMVHPLLP